METDQSKTPFFSIIIATFNAEKSIQQCLNSILAQQFAASEILIQDGGSNDGTPTIIDAYRENITYFVSCPDNGIYDAWNRALPHARGEWICFLGADDCFTDKNVLKNYSGFLTTRNPKTKVVYGINHIVNSEGETLYPVGTPWQELRSLFYKTMCLPHQGMMHRRSVFDDVGLFDDTYTIAADYELLLRIFQNSQPEHWPNPVCRTPLGGISTVPQNNLICLKEIKRAQMRNGLPKHSLLGVKLWVGAVIRLMMWRTMGEKNARILLDALRKVRGLGPFWSRAY